MVSESNFSFDIEHGNGPFALLRAKLPMGGSIKAQSGAMVAMASTINITGKAEGGMLGGLGRMLAGENFFFQTLTAERGAGEVLLAPAAPCDLIKLELDGTKSYKLQKGSFFASTEGVTINTKTQNLAKGLFSGKGFFILEVSGHGTLFAETFGAMHLVKISAGEEYVIDNEHLVAWESHVNFSLEKASKSGWLSSMTSGEGFVCRFRGPADLIIQTRNRGNFGTWVSTLLPTK